jgi:hypothetical protein
VMKSSHSGTPMLSPVAAVVPLAGVVADAGLSVALLPTVVLLLFVVSVFEQAINTRPQTRDNTKIVVLRINCSFFLDKHRA